MPCSSSTEKASPWTLGSFGSILGMTDQAHTVSHCNCLVAFSNASHILSQSLARSTAPSPFTVVTVQRGCPSTPTPSTHHLPHEVCLHGCRRIFPRLSFPTLASSFRGSSPVRGSSLAGARGCHEAPASRTPPPAHRRSPSRFCLQPFPPVVGAPWHRLSSPFVQQRPSSPLPSSFRTRAPTSPLPLFFFFFFSFIFFLRRRRLRAPCGLRWSPQASSSSSCLRRSGVGFHHQWDFATLLPGSQEASRSRSRLFRGSTSSGTDRGSSIPRFH